MTDDARGGVRPSCPCRVAVLIPTYNNPEGLRRSLASVASAEGEWVVVVVDDGSNPPIDPHDVAPLSSKTVVLRNSTNKGVAAALNEGLRYIMAQPGFEYIARLDAGDEVHPARFVKQLECFQADGRLGIVGSWVAFVDRVNPAETFVYCAPSSSSEVRRTMPVRNVLIHPTVMMKKRVIEEVGRYSMRLEACEDYDLFWRILRQYEGMNIPEVLTFCEQNAKGISSGNRRGQLWSKLRIQLAHFSLSCEAAAGVAVTVVGLILPYALVRRMRRWRFLRSLTFVESYGQRGQMR